jgi:MFS family permease
MILPGVDRRIIALGLARMADAVANSFLIIVLPLYIASGTVGGWGFGLSEAAITGLVLGAFGIVNSVVQPFAGRLSDRAGRRKAFILFGLVALGVVTLGYAQATSYTVLLSVRLLQAAGAAFTIVGSVALVSELSPPGGRGKNMGVYNSFRLFGFGAGPLAAGFVVEHGPYALGSLTLSGFEAAFYGAAAAAFVSAALVALLVSDPDDIEPTDRSTALRVFAKKSGRGLDPIFALGVASLFMASCIALLSPIETVVNERLGQGPVLFGVEFAAFIATQVVLQPLVGRLSDEYGHRRFILWGLAGLVPATLFQGIVVAPWQMIAARLLQGGAAAMVFAPALALAGEIAEEGQSGAQLSVLTVSFGLGIAAGQVISGFLIRFGFLVPFVAGALLAAAGLVLVGTQVPGQAPSDTSSKNALSNAGTVPTNGEHKLQTTAAHASFGEPTRDEQSRDGGRRNGHPSDRAGRPRSRQAETELASAEVD